MPKFQETSCSQCGQTFGPGDHGYSHCEHHQPYFRLKDNRIVILKDALNVAKYELAALIARPDSAPHEEHEWPCENPADSECLQKAWVAIHDALEATADT